MKTPNSKTPSGYTTTISSQLQAQIENRVIQKELQDDPDLQFDNPKICTYQKKLSQLYEFEEALLKEDKMKKENRRNIQTICRMQGSLSQSYFLFDSQKLNKARNIFFDLNDVDLDYKRLGIWPDLTENGENSSRPDNEPMINVIDLDSKLPRFGGKQDWRYQT